MSLKRGRLGVEYDAPETEGKKSWRKPLIWAIVAITVMSFAWTTFTRLKNRVKETPDSTPSVAQETRPVAALKSTWPRATIHAVSDTAADLLNRPRNVKHLLMRLREAESEGDIIRQIDTLETLRTLPGKPAADLEPLLARRLSELNWHRLFDKPKPISPWTTQIKLRKGLSLERLATEYGTTLAATLKLNGIGSPDELPEAAIVTLLHNPRFSLIVHRSGKYAELYLNERFFKIYNLTAPVRTSSGNYRITKDMRRRLAELDVWVSPRDRAQLELFLIADSPVIISDY